MDYFKKLSLCENAIGYLDLNNGKLVAEFSTLNADDFVLPLKIAHLFNAGNNTSCYGAGWRTSLNKQLKLSQNDDEHTTIYTYVDEMGEQHTFNEKYYVIEADSKTFVNKDEVSIDINGNLTYNNKPVYKYQSCEGYTLIPEINDYIDSELIRQKQDEEIELEDYIRQQESALQGYVIVNADNGEKISELSNLNKSAYDEFICGLNSNERAILITKSKSIKLRSLYRQYNKLADEDEKALLNEQITDFITRAQVNLPVIKEEFRKYFSKKAEYVQVLMQTPVAYLRDENGIINGFSKNGNLVLIADSYGNYVGIEYDAANNIESIYDSNKKVINFEYVNGLLQSVTDNRGRKVKYAYDSSNRLTKITYTDGQAYGMTYNANNGLATVTSANGEKCMFGYNSGLKLSEVDFYKNDKPVSWIKISYDSNFGIKFINDKEITETYKFNSDKKLIQYTTKDETNKQKTQTYTYENDGKKVTIVTTDNVSTPKLTQVKEYNDLDLLVEERVVGHEFLVDTTEDVCTTYTYDINNKLVCKKAAQRLIISENDGEDMFIYNRSFIENYSYDSYGNLTLTESYVVGEEKTSGINFEERVYNDKGIMVKCIRWNSLDSSSKFYEEYEREDNGRIKYEKDETGAYSALYEYNGGSNVVNSVTYSNGGKLVYGRNPYNNQITSVTASTADGEASTNDITYENGLPVKVKSGNTTIEYQYDEKGRKTEVKVNGATQVKYSYDTNSTGYNFGDKQELLVTGSGNIIKTVQRSGSEGKNKVVKVLETKQIGSDTVETNTYDEKGRIYSKLYKTEDGQRREAIYEYDYCDTLNRVTTFGKSAMDLILRETYSYDGEGGLIEIMYEGSISQRYDYKYKDTVAHELESMCVGNYTYRPLKDVYGRNTGREILLSKTKIAGEHITYRKVGDHATNMPASISFGIGENISDNIKYKYDSCGNISEISENGHTVARYTYDSLNRLIREDNKPLNKTVTYTYDSAGNITEKCEYDYTEYAVVPHDETSPDHYRYLYDGDKLMDCLEVFDDRILHYNCEYNSLGNPTKYRGKVCEWQYGNRLTKYGSTTFAYDSLGRRTKKGSTTYIYDSEGRLLKSNGLVFIYDASGVAGVVYDGATYFYRKDAQGNIIAILNSDGAVVVQYNYDAWGDHVVSGSNADLGEINPFRYRSYYYDTETKLYYLQTRYYDPEIGRFISQDSIEYADPETINGLNLYAYCGNNPVMGYDPTGTWNWGKIFKCAISILIGIGTVIVAMCQGRWADLKSDLDIGCFNPFNENANIALDSKVFSFYKGESVVRRVNNSDGLQIFGTIFLGDGITDADILNHEFGHGIQERFLGFAYLTRVALPSVITYAVSKFHKRVEDNVYYSMPWERTADWFGGVNRTFKNGSVTKSYKNGSLGWAFAENILGVGLIPWYFIFGF